MRIAVLLLLSCFVARVAAQQTIRGYYINLDRDTVVGDFVNFRTAYANPSKVMFQRLGGGATEVLKPENCLLFSLRHYDVYVARHITRLIDPVEMSSLVSTIDSADHYQGVTTFLELIFSAKGIHLYEYHDQLRSNFFVEEPDGSFYELIYKLSVHDNMLTTDARFRRQLRSLFAKEIGKNKKLDKMISALQYQRPSLLRFFERATGNPLGSLRRYQSPDIILLAGAAMPYSAAPGIYDVSGTVLMPGIGVIGYSRDLKKSFFELQLSGFMQRFKKDDPGSSFKNVYSYKAYRMDLQLSVGRWLYEKGDLHTYITVGSGFLVTHAIRTHTDASRADLSDFVRPIFNIKAGVLLNSNFGFWLSAEPLRLSTGDNGFYLGNFSQRVIAAGVQWRLSI